MGYSKEMYTAVFDDLADLRQKNLALAESRKEDLFKKIPELRTLIQEHNQTGLRLSRMILQEPQHTEAIIQDFERQSNQLIQRKETLLSNLGLPFDYLDPPFSCKLCQDTGFVDEKSCRCMEKRLRDKTYEKLNQLSNLQLSHFHNFDLDLYPITPDEQTKIVPRKKMSEIFAYCQKYSDSFTPQSRSILMIGGTGLGKTHLSLAIGKAVIDKGYGVVYGSTPNLLGMLENEKFGRETNSTNSLTSLIECDLLILDDLGTEFQTPFTTSTIYNLINSRISRNLPTIINTNLTHRELENVYSPRILSRLSGIYDTLYFLGSDIRPMLKNR